MENEICRYVPGFVGKYKIRIADGKCECISINYGRTGVEKVLSNRPLKNGYITWNLSKNNIKTSHQAAVWVAITFPEMIQNEYFDGAQIDHIDTNRLNNHPFNLRWVTRKGQMENSLTKKHLKEACTGRVMSVEARRKLVEAHKQTPILQYDLEGNLLKEWISYGEIERVLGFPKSNIKACCNKKKYHERQYAYGFIWKRKEA